MTKVLLVCMGNICRSPTAEGVLRRLVETRGLTGKVMMDSAGTHDYHVGDQPDRRAQQTAARRGYDLSGLRGRQVSQADFREFDYVLAMDQDNLAHLRRLCPQEHAHKLHLLLEYSTRFSRMEVPDPYFGGQQGFENVLDMIEDAAAGLLEEIAAKSKR
jgi:protein-tyrosine phosphatase